MNESASYRLTPEEWAEVENEIDPKDIYFGTAGTEYDPKTGKLIWVTRKLCELSDFDCLM
jgi:hypothetical protein